jgi:hypothetical protein
MVARPARPTTVQMWEQISKQVLGQDANVALDMVIEDESGGNGRFVVPTPSLPLPMGMGQVDGCRRRHRSCSLSRSVTRRRMVMDVGPAAHSYGAWLIGSSWSGTNMGPGDASAYRTAQPTAFEATEGLGVASCQVVLLHGRQQTCDKSCRSQLFGARSHVDEGRGPLPILLENLGKRAAGLGSQPTATPTPTPIQPQLAQVY